MRKIVNKIYQNNTIIYKVLLFLITTVAIVYLFPKGGQFKYEFNNGKVWKYDNLYATFDFAIQKTEAEIIQEKEAISANSKYYFLKILQLNRRFWTILKSVSHHYQKMILLRKLL